LNERALWARDGAVATVTVNRPEARNALDGKSLDALIQAFGEVERDGAVSCAILTGAGDRAFVAGADIKAMAGLDPVGARSFSEHGRRLCDLLEGLSVPVIAAVNGWALGAGFELALACDFIYAARGAKVGLPEVGLGVIPGMGGTQRLTRRIGAARARELIYTAGVIDADEALRLGLVNAVAEPAQLLDRVRAVAEAIAKQAPLAVAAAKRAIREGGTLSLEAGIDREQQFFAGLFATKDQEEGMRAFIEKRAPVWTGK
jgi:enoyl-CoA hydratase